MPRALAYPWIYVTELLVWLVFISSFFVVVSFASATPIAELDPGGKSPPSHWEAAYRDHGWYLRAYLVSKHPFQFALSLSVLILSFFALRAIKNEQASQVHDGGESRARAHTIANRTLASVVFIFIMFVFKFLVSQAIPA
jgi:hypothetical protein